MAEVICTPRCKGLLMDLLGTLAKGRVHEWSDIDLIVVEQTSLPFFQRLRKVRKLLQPKVGMDIMVYTPEEFNLLCAERRAI
jgi:predicted nucleotidyltransferase